MRYPFEEFCTVILAPSVADITAPTLAEIAAGTDITCFLTKDGLNPGGSTNMVEAGTLCTRVDGETVGSVKYSFMLKGYRDNDVGGDTFWDLADWATPTVVIVRRGIQYGTAFAATQDVEVYDGAMAQPTPAGSAANTNQTFELGIAVENAELKAVVAA